jgi:hypothetical protein
MSTTTMPDSQADVINLALAAIRARLEIATPPY